MSSQGQSWSNVESILNEDNQDISDETYDASRLEQHFFIQQEAEKEEENEGSEEDET